MLGIEKWRSDHGLEESAEQRRGSVPAALRAPTPPDRLRCRHLQPDTSLFETGEHDDRSS
jgi:hypothetical protein